MSSKIEQLIDEIESYIGSCKFKTFSNSEIIVNKDDIEGLLQELKNKTPEEIKRYQKIISNKEAILNDARERANALVEETAAQTYELINEHQIMIQAHKQADEVVRMATTQAQEILDNATMEANALKESAVQYTDGLLANIEDMIAHYLDVSSGQYQSLMDSLTECYNTVQEIRSELYPQVEDTGQDSDSESGGGDEVSLDII